MEFSVGGGMGLVEAGTGRPDFHRTVDDHYEAISLAAAFPGALHLFWELSACT